MKVTREQLLEIVNDPINQYADLNYLDISDITSMRYMFYFSHFNGDISNWDTSNVTDMSYMFANSQFNGC